MIGDWSLVVLSAVAVALWMVVAWRVRDERAPYVWLLVLTGVSLLVSSLTVYADAAPADAARLTASVLRVVLVLAGAYALWYVIRRRP